MARRTAGIKNRTWVVTEATVVDLTSDPGDVETGMTCPGDNAKVVSVAYTMQAKGTGSAANHQLTLEHGLGAAGVALTLVVDVDADAANGTIVTADGLDRSGQGVTTLGTMIQLLNAESASITTGAKLDIQVLWEL